MQSTANRGFSSQEMWYQHDKFSNCQLPMSDHHLIAGQHDQRLTNHPHSAKSKAPLAQPRPTCRIEVGDLVYIHSDRNKSRARDRYLVTQVDGAFCHVRKFIGSQLRSTSYRVKNSECYKVPGELSETGLRPQDDSSGDEEDPIQPANPPPPPDIPEAISYPAEEYVPQPGEFSPRPTACSSEDSPPDQVDEMPVVNAEEASQPRRSTRRRRRPTDVMLCYSYVMLQTSKTSCSYSD